MVDVLAPHIDNGRVKVFCVNSVNNDSWYDKKAHPGHRSWLQTQYDAYIANEVAPFIHDNCKSPGIAIATTGASFGGYYAANTLLKHQVLIGSDYPMITPDRWLADFEQLGIDDDVRPLILKENAARLLNLRSTE